MTDQSRSEFDGGGVMPSTVHPKPEEALTNGDRLRLMSLTGQETDTNASLDPGFWQGNAYFDPTKRVEESQDQKRRRAELRRQESGRYQADPTPRVKG